MIKTHISRFICACLCMILLPLSALGEYAFVQLGAKTYSEPNTGADLVSYYKAGTWLEIEEGEFSADGMTQGFLYVTGTDGLMGYVSLDDVFVESMVDSSDIAVVANNGKYVNLRSEASKSASVLAKINSGTPMILNAASKAFDEVTVGGVHGYMASGLLKTGLRPIYTPCVSSSNGKSVNLREEPSIDSAVIAHVPNNAQVKVYILGGGWAKVSYQKKTGFMMSKFLSSAPPKPAPNPTPDDPKNFWSVEMTGYVSNRGASVRYRTGPGTNYPVVGKVNSGNQVYVAESNGAWDKIYIGAGGSTVYMMSRYIVFVMPDPFIPAPNPNPDDPDVDYVMWLDH